MKEQQNPLKQEMANPALEGPIQDGFCVLPGRQASPGGRTSLGESVFCLVRHKTRHESEPRGLDLPNPALKFGGLGN